MERVVSLEKLKGDELVEMYMGKHVAFKEQGDQGNTITVAGVVNEIDDHGCISIAPDDGTEDYIFRPDERNLLEIVEEKKEEEKTTRRRTISAAEKRPEEQKEEPSAKNEKLEVDAVTLDNIMLSDIDELKVIIKDAHLKPRMHLYKDIKKLKAFIVEQLGIKVPKGTEFPDTLKKKEESVVTPKAKPKVEKLKVNKIEVTEAKVVESIADGSLDVNKLMRTIQAACEKYLGE